MSFTQLLVGLHRGLNISQLIGELRLAKQDADVWFDFDNMKPTGHFYSYRGIYSDVALGYDQEGDPLSVAELIDKLTGMIGSTVTGYKGGDYKVQPETPVWVSKPSNAFGTAVVAVHRTNYMVVLCTAWIDL